MKRKIFYLTMMLMVCMTGMSQTKDIAGVKVAVEILRRALVDGDSVRLMQIVSDRVSYGHSSGKLETRPEMIRALRDGSSDFVSISLSDQTIEMFHNTAIVRHTLNATTNDHGQAGSVLLSVLLVWEKEKGNWKLVARQAVKPK